MCSMWLATLCPLWFKDKRQMRVIAQRASILSNDTEGVGSNPTYSHNFMARLNDLHAISDMPIAS